MLPRCLFDETKTEKGLNALRQYRADWDSKNKTPRKTPLHDWSSHGADAFRELAVQLFDIKKSARYQPLSISDYDPLRYLANDQDRRIELDRQQLMAEQESGAWRPW
jgi:phage terminase large subunit